MFIIVGLSSKMEVKSNNDKEKIIVFDKQTLSGPLSNNSRYIEHLAENDPDQPGKILPFKKFS
jgi:hypothetical protein